MTGGMKARKIPVRSCVGCREKKPKKELVRIVRTPDGRLDLDPTGKAPGRGAYLCESEECLQKAVKTRSLNRALGVEIRDEILVDLCNRIRRT